MKHLALAAVVSLSSLLTVGSLSPAEAQPNGQPNAPSITVPVTGSGAAGTFEGTFTLLRIVATDDGVAAVGRLTGTVTDASGVVTSIVRTVALPTAIGDATCDILHLELGPLNLDLLGLNVDLSRIVLDITAESGAGNLLGNLLCQVAGLLDNPNGLARLLNQILSILG
jgi:hypothetical protein